MSSLHSAASLSDRELLDATARIAADERQATAELLALLGEVDARRLYLAQSCASLFTFCTQALHLSEHAAYHRIEAARAARQFPLVLEMVASGELTLTTVALLRPHLTRDNHIDLLRAARHKSKRDVEYQIACLAPRRDERATVHRLPATLETVRSSRSQPLLPDAVPMAAETVAKARSTSSPPRSPRAEMKPLSVDRFVLKVTVSAETHAKLLRAQDLLRHAIPSGDPAAVMDRALTLLIADLERTKCALRTAASRRSTSRLRVEQKSGSRHIPAAIRREVWSRDEGRCAFVGERGRCSEIGRLEFHHVIPFADGGTASADNLALRCQAHNGYEATLWSPTDGRVEGRSAQ